LKVLRIYVDDPKAIKKVIGPNVQIVRARCVEEVMHAVRLSERAFKRGTNHAKTIGGEVLMRLAGTVQIREAIDKVGLSKGFNYVILFNDEIPEGLKVVGDNGECEDVELKRSFERMALVEVL